MVIRREYWARIYWPLKIRGFHIELSEIGAWVRDSVRRRWSSPSGGDGPGGLLVPWYVETRQQELRGLR